MVKLQPLTMLASQIHKTKLCLYLCSSIIYFAMLCSIKPLVNHPWSFFRVPTIYYLIMVKQIWTTHSETLYSGFRQHCIGWKEISIKISTNCLSSAAQRVCFWAQERASDSRVINWELFSPSFDTFFLQDTTIVVGYANIIVVYPKGENSHIYSRPLENVTIRTKLLD